MANLYTTISILLFLIMNTLYCTFICNFIKYNLTKLNENLLAVPLYQGWKTLLKRIEKLKFMQFNFQSFTPGKNQIEITKWIAKLLYCQVVIMLSEEERLRYKTFEFDDCLLIIQAALVICGLFICDFEYMRAYFLSPYLSHITRFTCKYYHISIKCSSYSILKRESNENFNRKK